MRLLRQIPSIGPIRAALLITLMQTPHRFRTKRQLWAYCGLALRTYDSGEYRFVGSQLKRSKKAVTIRGLNKNHNHDLKNIFKGAAATGGPLQNFYEARIANGATRNTRAEKNRTINIETYKTRAEIKAENPTREGDEDYLRSARVCAILGISTTTLSRWNMESPPRISFIRLSKGNYRWRKSDVEAYMERQQINRREGDRRSASGGVQIDRRAADRRDVDRRNR